MSVERGGMPIWANRKIEEPTSGSIYNRRPIEGLVVPSGDVFYGMVVDNKKKLRDAGIKVEVPMPPVELFETLIAFKERGIKFDKVYYQPEMQLGKDAEFWKERKDRVKPKKYFWEQVEKGNYPEDVMKLRAQWVIGEVATNEQGYGENDFMGSIMERLRFLDKIETYRNVPYNLRFGASAYEIEKIIIPTFVEESGAKGEAGLVKFMERNFRGNMEGKKENSNQEWLGDRVFNFDRKRVNQLISGFDIGGPSKFASLPDHSRSKYIGYSFEVVFPINPR